MTDIVKPEILCSESGEWIGEERKELSEAIDKYNKSKSRFLFYPWGVFVTSYARRNLYSGILEFGEDYIYSDTDSIKCINIDRHMDYIRKYNTWITGQIDKVLESYKINPDKARPKNIKGEEKQIGVWDWETEHDPYTDFKTLGAKRYIYMQGGNMHITIAGVSKNLGKKYIRSRPDAFDFFSDDMEIPADYSGKLTHTYLDDEQAGTLTDYQGRTMDYFEKSSVHLEKSSYNLDVLESYIDFCKGVKRRWKR